MGLSATYIYFATTGITVQRFHHCGWKERAYFLEKYTNNFELSTKLLSTSVCQQPSNNIWKNYKQSLFAITLAIFIDIYVYLNSTIQISTTMNSNLSISAVSWNDYLLTICIIAIPLHSAVLVLVLMLFLTFSLFGSFCVLYSRT